MSPSSLLRPTSFVSCGAILLGAGFAGCLLSLAGGGGQTRDFCCPHSPARSLRTPSSARCETVSSWALSPLLTWPHRAAMVCWTLFVSQNHWVYQTRLFDVHTSVALNITANNKLFFFSSLCVCHSLITCPHGAAAESFLITRGSRGSAGRAWPWPWPSACIHAQPVPCVQTPRWNQDSFPDPKTHVYCL